MKRAESRKRHFWGFNSGALYGDRPLLFETCKIFLVCRGNYHSIFLQFALLASITMFHRTRHSTVQWASVVILVVPLGLARALPTSPGRPMPKTGQTSHQHFPNAAISLEHRHRILDNKGRLLMTRHSLLQQCCCCSSESTNTGGTCLVRHYEPVRRIEQ